jgi:hypothetical protein
MLCNNIQKTSVCSMSIASKAQGKTVSKPESRFTFFTLLWMDGAGGGNL